MTEHIRFDENGLLQKADFEVDVTTAQVVNKNETPDTTDDAASKQ